MNSCLTLLACDVISSRGPESGRAEGIAYTLPENVEGELMKLPQALFSYTKKLMTGFLTGHSILEERIFQSKLKCVLFQKIWFMAEVNPSPYPDNYSRSGFTDIHIAHICADPFSDGTARHPYSSVDG